MKIIEHFSVNNDCYKYNVSKYSTQYTNFQKTGAKGLMLHSVGCPQPSALVFAKNWNKSGASVAVHAVLQADGTVYQCLPWNYRGWHGGGSSNNTHIGVEMTEPDCIKYTHGSTFTCSDLAKAKSQVAGTYKTAVELFAYLCKKYNLNPLTDIVSHAEGYKKGIASGHADPEHLWTQLKTGYTMDGFRKAVKAAMSGETITPSKDKVVTENADKTDVLYRVRKSADDAKTQIGAYKNLESAKTLADKNPGYSVFTDKGVLVYTPGKVDNFRVLVEIDNLNIRKGASLRYASVGYCPKGIYTIVETKSMDGYTWGKLKSGAGWIALEYVERL